MLNEPLDQPTAPLNPQPKMPLGKVVLINFGIMLAYLLGTGLLMGTSGHDAALGSLIADAFLIVAQVVINFVFGLIFLFGTNLREVGRAMIISALLVGIIGFGACLGKVSILEA